METFQILILSIIQGLTEFLPISSSAHLIITSQVLNWKDQSLTMDIFAHGGSLFAVIYYFKEDLAEAIKHYDLSSADSFLNKLIIASIPIFLVGFIFRDFVSDNLRTLNTIAISTILFGFILWGANYFSKAHSEKKLVSVRDAFLIGLAQCFALIPGASRSAVTIICALFLSYSRSVSSKFAFMLAIPTLGVIFISELASISFSSFEEGWLNIFLITFFSFITSYACISLFLKFIERVGFMPFVLYRVILGGFLLLF